MTREEAIEELKLFEESAIPWDVPILLNAIDMAIEALEGMCFDEWCDDCKEYDTEKKCCPRFNRVIRGAVADALDAIPSTDRPMVIKCKPFLSEEDFKAFAEQVSDQNVILISDEAEAVSTNTSTNTSTKSTNISIDASADRPRGEWTLLTEERPVDDYEIIATVYWPGYGDSTIAVGHIDRFDNWHLYSPTEGELIKGFEVIAWKTLPEPYKEGDTE